MFEPFKVSYLAEVVANLSDESQRDIEALDCYSPNEMYSLIADDEAYRTTALTVMDSGCPVALCGLYPVRPGVGHFWFLGTPKANTLGLKFAKAASDFHRHVEESGLYHRVHTISHSANRKTHRWLDFIGYEIESTLESFGADGANYYMWRLKWTR